MAKQEHPKEDMIRDATGLVQRVEARFKSFDEPVVVGFRENGAICFYFGEEPVFQFNTSDELRRVHDGYLFKAEAGRLVRLERVRQDGSSVLQRYELSESEQGELLEKAKSILSQLEADLVAERFDSVRQVPADSPILQRSLEWLQQVQWPVRVADVPNAV